MLRQRTMRKLHLKSSGELPFFQPPSSDVQDKHWQVSVIPERLQCRAVDLGDISPANTELFLKALNSPACGIQVTKTKVPNNKQGPLKFPPHPPPKVILGLACLHGGQVVKLSYAQTCKRCKLSFLYIILSFGLNVLVFIMGY